MVYVALLNFHLCIVISSFFLSYKTQELGIPLFTVLIHQMSLHVAWNDAFKITAQLPSRDFKLTGIWCVCKPYDLLRLLDLHCNTSFSLSPDLAHSPASFRWTFVLTVHCNQHSMWSSRYGQPFYSQTGCRHLVVRLEAVITCLLNNIITSRHRSSGWFLGLSFVCLPL